MGDGKQAATADASPHAGRLRGALALGLGAALVLASASETPLAAQVAEVSPSEGQAQGEGTPDRHQVVDGDTLSSVSERYLGSGDAWPKLWAFNPEITNPHFIYPGHVLRLHEGVDLATAPAGGPALASGKIPGSLSGLGARRGTRGSAAPGVIFIGEEVYLDREALATAGRIVGSSEDHLMLSPSDEVYVRYGDKSTPPAPGKELTVFVRQHRAEVSAKAGKVRAHRASGGGEIVRVRGGVRVLSVDTDKRIARALVIEALDSIERGFQVADVPRTLRAVPPKKSERDLKARIVAATWPLGTLGEGQMVFLDAGAKQGVETGHRFVVVRQGDPWRQQLTLREDLSGAERPDDAPARDDELPPEVVAELRVLYVRPDSSTALITASTVEVGPGEHVELRAGY